MKQEQKTRYIRYKKELPFLNNYVKRMNDIKNAYDYIETSYIESKSKKQNLNRSPNWNWPKNSHCLMMN